MCELLERLIVETNRLNTELIDADLSEQLIQISIIKFLTEEVKHAAICEAL